MDHTNKDAGTARSSPAPKNGDAHNHKDDENDNASSDMNEVDFDKDGQDSLQGSPKSSEKRKVVKKKAVKPSAKLIVDKKKLEQYIGEGEMLVPVPRARRRLKGNELGYMVKRGEEVVRYIDKDGIVYNPNDTAYLQNREKGKPYFVCAIQRFNLTKRDTLMVGIKWFFRLSEVPGSVYHHLTLDRELHRKNGEDFIHDTSIQQRELFSSEATDTLPITSLRGKCHVVQYTDLRSACSFVPSPDHFFYILAYRPDNRRLATTQGEIRVGPSHQARLPECKPDTNPADMPEKCEHREEIRWRPNRVVDGDLLMYLGAARSIAAFAGMCGGTAEDRCEAEAMDETTVNALDTLHKHNYDTSKSLQALVKGPSVMYTEKKWNEEDVKRFAKGLRHLGKNFFKIRKEHLPHKDTSELVEFYYFWKKSPAANNSRPTYRSRHRRQLKRQSPRNNQPDNEVSTGSESAGEESEESDGSRDVASRCQRCFTTSSKDWHNAKDGGVLCTKCRLSYKKYGEESGVDSPPPSTSPDQYLFKPVPEDEESTPSKHNMRTRRSNNTSSTNGKKKDINSVSSPDVENTPTNITNTIATTAVALSNSSKGARKSPSNPAVEKDNRKSSQKPKDSNTGKAKKRRLNIEEDAKTSKKKKERSDSESGTESSSVSGTEDLGNEADSDDNNQEELSSSSRPSSRSSVERGFKPLQPQPSTPGSLQVVPTAGAPTSKVLTPTESAAVSNISTLVSTSAPTVFSSTTGIPKPQTAQPVSTFLPPQQYQPFATVPSSLPPLTGLVPGTILVSSTTPTTTSLTPSGNNLHHRPPRHSSPLPVFKPGIAAPGHISSIGTITNNHTGPVPTTCNLSSQLVIPTPTLSRASSTGTFIPHTELSVPAISVNVSANINTVTTATPKTISALTSVDSVISSSTLSSRSTVISSSSNSSTSNCNSLQHNRMQEQNEEQDKKPIVPSPGAFLPPPPGSVPFSPYHYFYGGHPGAGHLPQHLHPMSVASAVAGNPHQPPPPVPSLVPIKKEPHSPPPPLKPSEKASDLSTSSSSHPLHRPHPENPSKLSHSFSQPSLSSSAPLPPPPLTVLDPRDSSKSEDLSKPDSYSKDNHRGPPQSPHRPESLPTSGMHRESRMDSNLSVLQESRAIGLVGGLNPPPPGAQLHKDDPRVLPAAFQPYSHHPHPSSSSLPHHPSSVLQVPQPHLSSNQSHLSSALHSAQSHMTDSTLHMNHSNSDMDSVVKKEPITVEEIDVDEDEDDGRGGSTTPGPTPTACSREIYKSKNAIFVKIFDRGERNQCSRTDFIFRPMSDSSLAKKREERARKPSQSSAIKEEKKRVETPPRATSASEGQKSSSSSSSSSNLNSASGHPHGMSVGGGGYQERHTPRPFADTPALRQLHEYARPHVYARESLDDSWSLRFAGQDLGRGPYSIGGLPHHPQMDPLMGYRLGMYPPGSRERLEMELERDKRERDAREREMRERELRDLELREKMKQDMELKPEMEHLLLPYLGLDRLLPPGAANQLTDPNWLDLQRRMGFPPGSAGHLLPHGGPSGAGSHLPGVYPPVSLASDLLAREREKLDRLDGAAASSASANSTTEHLSSRMVYQYYSQRLTSEQHVFMQRVVNECYLRTKPESRPIIDPNHLIYQFSRADPLAGGPGGSGPGGSSNPLSVLPPGVPHPLLTAAGSREELLQRELYSRGGPFLDPALAHQLSAQAAAHEAIQRHIAMERERYGSSGHLPH